MDRQPSGRPGLALPFCSRSREEGPSEDDRAKLQAVGCAFGKLGFGNTTLSQSIACLLSLEFFYPANSV